MKPQTIQIFLPDGSPTNIKEAGLTNHFIKFIRYLYLKSQYQFYVFLDSKDHQLSNR